MDIEILDITGRRVLARTLGPLSPGTHRIDLDGPAPLPVGVYMVRATHGGDTWSGKVVVVR